jgi:hypothetical protein
MPIPLKTNQFCIKQILVIFDRQLRLECVRFRLNEIHSQYLSLLKFIHNIFYYLTDVSNQSATKISTRSGSYNLSGSRQRTLGKNQRVKKRRTSGRRFEKNRTRKKTHGIKKPSREGIRESRVRRWKKTTRIRVGGLGGNLGVRG